MASAFRMINPFREALPTPTMSAMGVASPRAQGHAITTVATKTKIAMERLSKERTQGRKENHAATEDPKRGLKKYQKNPPPRARAMMRGTNNPVILSARA